MAKQWKSVVCRVDLQTYTQFKEKCGEENSNMNRVMRGLIDEYLADGNGVVTDTLTVDLTKRVERLEEKENQGWLNKIFRK